MTNNKTLKRFNEVGVEAFIIACLGTLNSLPGIILLIIQRIFPTKSILAWIIGLANCITWFGYVFCVLAIVLSICAYVDIFKHNMRGYYGYSIASICVAIFGPVAMVGIRMLIILL